MKVCPIKQERVTAERVRHLFAYNPATGQLIRKVGTLSRAKAGMIAGTLSHHGYLTVCVNGRSYMVHRIVWLYVHGEWPAQSIDHINGDRSDNRLENLRVADHHQNGYNRKPSRNSSTGIVGVYWSRHRGLFSADITFQGKTIYLGRFATLNEAVAVRRLAEWKYFGQYSRQYAVNSKHLEVHP